MSQRQRGYTLICFNLLIIIKYILKINTLGDTFCTYAITIWHLLFFFPLLCSGEQFYRWLCSISEQLCEDLKQMLKQTTNYICFKSALTDEANHPTPNIRLNVDGGLNAVYFPIMLCDEKGKDNSTLTEPQKPRKYETESCSLDPIRVLSSTKKANNTL